VRVAAACHVIRRLVHPTMQAEGRKASDGTPLGLGGCGKLVPRLTALGVDKPTRGAHV